MDELELMLRRIKIFLIAVTLVSGGVVAGLILASSLPGRGRPMLQFERTPQVHAAAMREAAVRGEQVEVPSALLGPPPTGGEPLPSPFAAVAARVIPSVVSVESRRTVSHPRVEGPEGDILRRMFPDDGEGDQDIQVPSSGSGFIIDPSGFVLTNDHVVNGSETLTIHLEDGTELDAWLVGSDPGTDVAILKIDLPPDLESLPAVPLGNSDEIRVGDWAIAIGNPLGELEGTFTVGVISAVGRRNLQIVGGGPMYQDFLQTDASINFGNSGGPLVNVRGEVIGINSAVNPTGQGLGFTIPINMAREVALELIQTGTVHRGYLGIIPQAVTAEIREAWDDPALAGILVGSVEDGTPASQGGLRVGDVIVEFNRSPVTEVSEFRALVAEAGVGEEVPIRLLRDGDQQNLTVVLAERPDTPEPPARRVRTPRETNLGFKFEDISTSLVESYELPVEEGVVVTGVDAGSPARRGGLRVGDVILEVNRSEVGSKLQVEREMVRAQNLGKPVVLLVRRGTTTTYVSVRSEG